MVDWQLKTPVALILFKRPDTTKRVLEAIRYVKPPVLFVIADGPRPDKHEEVERCAETRAIIDCIDWNCEVIKNYSDENMGCGLRPATGISWVFDQVEEAIILEDDCIPHPTFFRFCQELLDQYRHDERIFMISGTNTFGEWKSHIQSYHFSYISTAWGWATWRRAWQHYDFYMKLWSDPEVKNRIRDVLGGSTICNKLFDSTYNGQNPSAWDIQWIFTRLSQSGLVINPAVNLVTNVGFGEDATHHKSSSDPKANLVANSMSFPLKSPPALVVDREFDNLRFEMWRKNKSLITRFNRKIKKLIANYSS